ncbi:MAG: hypothetical protein QFX36_04010 [Archaeoglobales archaeon]|nr:hypothetical protein [Archaeoglobales archaeon]
MSLGNALKVGIEQLKASKTARLFGVPAAAGAGVGAGAYMGGAGVAQGLNQMGQETEKKVSGLAITVVLLLISAFLFIKVIEAWQKKK